MKIVFSIIMLGGVRAWTFFVILCLASTAVVGQIPVQNNQISTPHWYTVSEPFDLNPDDDWLPLPEYDVPYSLPLRGYNSHSRNYFIDLGALDWLSDLVEYYGYPIPPFERGINVTHIDQQIEYLFELMTARLAEPRDDPLQALDYVNDLEGTFEVYIPLVVMFDLNSSYEQSAMDEWAIHPDLIEETLDNAFPFIDWIVEVFWFDYENAIDFADLVEEKTYYDRINIDQDFLDRCDVILYDIISEESKYSESDFVLPALVLFQEYKLYNTFSHHHPRGIGRIPSAYDEISSWCLNSLLPTSLFFGGDPSKIRFSITSTILHELCHCIGQTDIHNSFGWIMASTTTSIMASYTRDPHFDRLDKDLINNAQALQLLGKYLDEIAYFREFSLSNSQLTDLQDLETSLSEIHSLLISSDYITLKSTLQAAELLCGRIASELGVDRKDEDWSSSAPALKVQVDWIIGPGFSDTNQIVDRIESKIDLTRELFTVEGTILPSPLYDVTIDVHAVDDIYGNTLLDSFGSSIVETRTSLFDPEKVPDDAWNTYPLNRIFQNISGYAIDGDTAEQWLVDNPATQNQENCLHYRFYIFNLENITIPESNLMLLLIISGGLSALIVIVVVILFKRRK
jgi:hypothetical protein